MHLVLKSLILASTSTALMAGAAHSYSGTSFIENITLPAAQPVKISVSLSEDMAHRANALPKAFHDRGSARGSRDGFNGNGFYGQKDLDRLKETVAKDLVKALSKNGVSVSDSSAYTLNVVITDARPSRPTFTQMKQQVNLSMNSIALGGAQLDGELVNSAGQSVGTVSYGWYENDLRHSYALRSWSDAERAISRFASKTAESILD